MPTSAKNTGTHILFLPSTMHLKCSEGMYLQRNFNIHLKYSLILTVKAGFRQTIVWDFFMLIWDFFFHFMPRLCTITLSSKPPSLTQMVRIRLGMRPNVTVFIFCEA